MDDTLLATLMPSGWPTFALVSARVAGVVMTAPVWTQRTVPARIRGAFAVVLTVLLVPMVPRVALPDQVLALPIPIMSELLIGAAMGLVAGVFLHAAWIAAEVAAVQMGLSLGAAISAATDIGSPGIGQVQGTMVLLMYLTLGGPLVLISGLGASFDVVPAGTILDLSQGATQIIAVGDAVYTAAVRIAAPVMVALLLTHAAFALLNRAVPQINTLMLSFPATVGVGLIMLGAATPFIGGLARQWHDALPYEIENMIGAVAPVPGSP